MSIHYYEYFFKIYGNKLLQKMRIQKRFKYGYLVHERGTKTANDINRDIYNGILSDQPFFAGRLGAVEFSIVRDYLFSRHFTGRYMIRSKLVEQLHNCAGFFPQDEKLAISFAELMLKSVAEVDVLIRWIYNFENYVIEEYTKKDTLLASPISSFEPWQTGVSLPWSAALEGKKVLVIHPFEDSIIKQYNRREQLFPGSNILPAFELITQKAVQTIAGQKDDRFKTWFEALDYMYNEAMKKDFDVAIIGCGAYGFPLAAKLKQAGKKAIHLAGATQILFGIKGKRWEGPNYQYVQRWFNDAWIYPNEQEKPKNADIVEDACYW